MATNYLSDNKIGHYKSSTEQILSQIWKVHTRFILVYNKRLMLENVGALVQFWTKIARKYGLEIESHNRLKLIFKAATLGFKLLKGLVFFLIKQT